MKSKKILLGSLSTMALVATPIAAVVSCDNGKTAEAGKKAAFQAADLIKKIKADNKGVIASTPMGEFYFSEADAKKASTIDMMGNTIKFPALTDAAGKAKTGTLKMEITLTDEGLAAAKKRAKDAVTGGDAAAQKAAADKVTKVQSHDITVAKVAAEAFVVNKHVIAPAIPAIEGILKDVLTVTEGKEGLYPFAFKKDPADALKPELTAESKTAFDKIFTDLGLQVTALEFEKAEADSKDITVSRLTIVKKTTPVAVKGSVQGDLDALKVAIPATTATGTTASATTAIPTKGKGEIKGASSAMTADELVKAINDFIKVGSSFLAKPGTLNDALIKDDMVISAQITKAAGAASGTLTLTFSKASLNDVTTTIIITK